MSSDWENCRNSLLCTPQTSTLWVLLTTTEPPNCDVWTPKSGKWCLDRVHEPWDPAQIHSWSLVALVVRSMQSTQAKDFCPTSRNKFRNLQTMYHTTSSLLDFPCPATWLYWLFLSDVSAPTVGIVVAWSFRSPPSGRFHMVPSYRALLLGFGCLPTDQYPFCPHIFTSNSLGYLWWIQRFTHLWDSSCFLQASTHRPSIHSADLGCFHHIHLGLDWRNFVIGLLGNFRNHRHRKPWDTYQTMFATKSGYADIKKQHWTIIRRLHQPVCLLCDKHGPEAAPHYSQKIGKYLQN